MPTTSGSTKWARVPEFDPSCGKMKLFKWGKQGAERLKMDKNILNSQRQAIEEELIKQLFIFTTPMAIKRLENWRVECDHLVLHSNLEDMSENLKISTLKFGSLHDSLHLPARDFAKRLASMVHRPVKKAWRTKPQSGHASEGKMLTSMVEVKSLPREKTVTDGPAEEDQVTTPAEAKNESMGPFETESSIARKEPSPEHELGIAAIASETTTILESDLTKFRLSQAISVESNMAAVAAEIVKVNAELAFTPQRKSFQVPSSVPMPVPIPTITETVEESDEINTGSSAESSVQGLNINSGPSKDAMAISHMVSSLKETMPAGDAELVMHATDGCSVLPEPRKNVKRSIRSTVEKILKSIGDVYTRIGIYGPDGIGKSSVLKALEDDPKTKRMFDIIISVNVSRSWSIRKMQDEVARKLLLNKENFEAHDDIAQRFLPILQKKKFLLILDDVWEKINLDELGISESSLADGSRLIFATRSLKVCQDMAENVIEVKSLSFEEACDLFIEQVGQVANLPDIKRYARGIVEHCCGLPLLIILTGRALTEEKDIGVWESAFKDFLLPMKVGVSDTEFLTQKFQFVYNRLKAHGTNNQITRTCDLQGSFLYCALFPQDQVISVPTLFECWMQEGLIAKNIADTCNNGHKVVKVLVDAALLEIVEDGHSVKMHKLIRDLALGQVLLEVEARRFLTTAGLEFTQLPTFRGRSFFGSSYQYLLKAGGGMTKATLEEEWGQAKMIFLMDNELDTLPEKPKCPNLSRLFLQRNRCLRSIPLSFFNHMPSLQVLNLSNTALTCLPKSISNLKILKELIMKDCENLVKLPPQLGVLQHLEVLDLSGTEIDQLPQKIEQLTSLRCMKVHFYGSVDQMEYSKLPSELLGERAISRLLSLRILGIVVIPGDPRWNKVVEAITREISKLSNLIDFSFYFPQVELLHLFIKSSMSWKGNDLKKFNFVAGHDVSRMMSRVPDKVDFEFNQRGQCLRFVNGETLPDAVCEVLSRTTAFYLDHHLQISNLSQFGACNMTWLEVCVVRECPKMEKIIDSEEMTFPLLELLSIHYLENLQNILCGSLSPGSFVCLKYLYVHTCHRLDCVVTSSMSLYFSNLEELVVEDCSAMMKIIREDNDKIVEPNDILLPRLRSLKLHYLPELVCIWKGLWPSLERISIYGCPKLRNLNMDFDTELRSSIEEIKGERDWWSKLEWKDTSLSRELQTYFVPVG